MKSNLDNNVEKSSSHTVSTSNSAALSHHNTVGRITCRLQNALELRDTSTPGYMAGRIHAIIERLRQNANVSKNDKAWIWVTEILSSASLPSSNKSIT